MKLIQKEKDFLINWAKVNPEAFSLYNPIEKMSENDLSNLLSLADRQPDDMDVLQKYNDFLNNRDTLPTQKNNKNNMESEFKMTFKNSWWQCLVALLIGWILIRTIIIAILVFSHIGLGDVDISRVGVLGAFIFAIWLTRYLSRKIWERKQEKSKII